MLKMEERPMKESSTVVKLSTSNFGNLSIEKENIITFEQGLLGFEELKQFAIIDLEECLPFEWLVSVEDPIVAFPILNPTLFFSDYGLETPGKRSSILPENRRNGHSTNPS